MNIQFAQQQPESKAHGIHAPGIYLMADAHGFHVGKYTFRPMDPMLRPMGYGACNVVGTGAPDQDGMGGGTGGKTQAVASTG